jgi:prepilin-type N-terminal cleavage/methylation domain-containing protein
MTAAPASGVQMISAGEESGKLGEVLDEISGFYAKQLKDKIKAVTGMIEPIMILLMGTVVGFIAMAIILPDLQDEPDRQVTDVLLWGAVRAGGRRGSGPRLGSNRDGRHGAAAQTPCAGGGRVFAAQPGLARGFTLLESSMALVIIGVGVLAFVDAQSVRSREQQLVEPGGDGDVAGQ